MEFFTKSEKETKKLGELFAKKIKNLKLKKAIVFCLSGELGGGKTTFVKGLAKGFGIKKRILSPTFLIMRRFQTKEKKFKNFYHFDCYRINDPKEILKLNFKKIISLPFNIVAIEWGEKIEKILPKDSIKINFEFIDQKTRKISVKNGKIFRWKRDC
jgi:tRNA threonylcarbamoyladenosine biosynthesis protein TsaE